MSKMSIQIKENLFLKELFYTLCNKFIMQFIDELKSDSLDTSILLGTCFDTIESFTFISCKIQYNYIIYFYGKLIFSVQIKVSDLLQILSSEHIVYKCTYRCFLLRYIT